MFFQILYCLQDLFLYFSFRCSFLTYLILYPFLHLHTDFVNTVSHPQSTSLYPVAVNMHQLIPLLLNTSALLLTILFFGEETQCLPFVIHGPYAQFVLIYLTAGRWVFFPTIKNNVKYSWMLSSPVDQSCPLKWQRSGQLLILLRLTETLLRSRCNWFFSTNRLKNTKLHLLSSKCDQNLSFTYIRARS